MTDYYCPVEGCKFGESDEKTLQQVRSHINSMGDGDHRWSDLKGVVEGQGDAGNDAATSDDQPDDQPEGADGEGEATNDDTPEDTPVEGGEEGATSGDDQEMPTDEEIDQQWNGGKGADDGRDDTGGDTSQDTPSDGGPTGGTGGGIPVPISTTTLLVAGILVAVALFWVMRRRSNQPEISETGTEPAESGSTDDDQTTSDTMSRQSGGGLSG
ncbi:hypothetical protein [Halorubellus litoreus]|uniref:MYXO-CTERM domain-containing protein n=1 Tax=Halorubellus litoreus TaxID=755308 RepID=A0ABD5VDU5_9EURY